MPSFVSPSMNSSMPPGQGIPRCFPRPFLDAFRPHFRAQDEAAALVGNFRRDVPPPYWPPISLAPPTPHPLPMGFLSGTMAQDEEGDCFTLGEKLLKKQKRIRTRVDAGEPRNPYSAFGGFPSLCGVNVHSVGQSGGTTSKFFNNNNQTFCGLPFVNYFNANSANSRAMLSELFAGPTKPMVPCPADVRVNAMGVLDKVNSSSNIHAAEALNSVIRGPEADNVLLREILQGRKRDLLTMEDFDSVRSMHNNNIGYKSDHVHSADENSRDATRTNSGSANASHSDDDERMDSDVDEVVSQSPRPSTPLSDSDPKKSRLENIVSVIRSSPTPPTPVNGCKKRKLYLPQQHESRHHSDSPDDGDSPSEPENKTRRIEDTPDSRNKDRHDEQLQIDLTIRAEDHRIKRSPEQHRASSIKPPTTSIANEVAETSSYLLDYAKHFFRTQGFQRDSEQKQTSPVDLGEKLQLLRNINLNSQVTDLIEGLADVLKTEITASLAVIIDSIVNKYVQQRKMITKQAEAAAEQLNRDITSQLIERTRSPRPSNNNIMSHPFSPINNNNTSGKDRNALPNGSKPTNMHPCHGPLNLAPYASENNLNSLNLPQLRPQLYKSAHNLFPSSLPPTGVSVPVAQTSPYALQTEPEQDEALSLVVTPKKKRHKVTDSRLTPRTVGRLLEDLPRYPSGALSAGNTSPRGAPPPPHSLLQAHPPARPSFPQAPPPLLPVSLPTSVAIPNPSLHDTSLLYQNYYRGAYSPPESRRADSPPHLPSHHHPLLHPAALLAASSPDSFSHFLRGSDHDRGSDCSPAENHYDSGAPLSFYPDHAHWAKREGLYGLSHQDMGLSHSSTLTPMHLRKAKLMFFFVRYPSSSVLKTFFPDIKFNKNNTAQLVKWFSNFREFYYIQMEKYGRQAISEGVKAADDITVSMDSELIRVLNLHYNRNNHLEIPDHFRYVVEQTLREFYKALKEGKDSEQSWKKAIYKIIARMDESVPDYFKAPSFLDQLE